VAGFENRSGRFLGNPNFNAKLFLKGITTTLHLSPIGPRQHPVTESVALPPKTRECHMPSYRFAIRRGMAETEMLGFMKLSDDAEAFDFAKRIIQDMPDEDRSQGDTVGTRSGVFPAMPIEGIVVSGAFH
jgi:hypothetical protein